MKEMFIIQGIGIIRILLAMLLGFIVGIERKMRYKEAGIRTHSIVALGAALMLIVGMYAFEGDDSSRVAAQIVTGVGFLGAGVIMYRRDSLRGITTAAGIWSTAGIGMAAGAGMYVLAVGATALIVVAQCVFHLPISLFKTKQYFIYRIKFRCNTLEASEESENSRIKQFFEVNSFSRINFYYDKDVVTAMAEISTNKRISDMEMKDLISANKYIESVERIFQASGKD